MDSPNIQILVNVTGHLFMRFPIVLAVFMAFLISPICFAQLAPSESPVLGKWAFTKNGCTDTYEFRKNGTYSSTSGAEIRDGRFTVEILPDNPNASYKITRTNLHDNGGKDCTSLKNNSEMKDTRYLVFSASKDQMMVCPSPDAKKCFGPLIRQK